MNVEIKEVYVTYETVDEYGRRGSCRGIFSTRSRADNEAIGIGWYGGTGSVMPKNVIIVDDKAYLLESSNPVELDVSSKEAKEAKQRLKKTALSKLTVDEIKALGL